MARRKAKKPQEDDTSILLESTVSQSKRRINSYVAPALVFIIIFTVCIMGWFCIQQQSSLDQLSETFTTMQKRITNLQQVMEMTDAQLDTGFGLEERIFALEEAQKQAQEKAEVALAMSEKLKNSGQFSQLWALHDEMDTRLTEIKQVTLSVTALQAMFKNQSEKFEAMKKSVVAGLSSSSALAESVVRLSATVSSACSRIDNQVASVDALNAQLAGQASELNELKESMHLHHVALHTNNQDMAAIKELSEAKQAMHAQALEEMLRSVQTTLDEQFSTSQTVRSSVMAQLQTFHTQLANAPSWTVKQKSNEEDQAAEEFILTTAQNVSEVQEMIEAVEEEEEEKEEQQDVEDEAGEDAKEEKEEEDKEEAEEEAEEDEAEEDEVEEDEEEAEEEAEEDEAEEDEVEEDEEEDEAEEDEEAEVEEEEAEEDEEEQPLEQEVEGGTIEEQEDDTTAEEEEKITEEEQDNEEITEQSEEQVVPEEPAEEEDAEETVEAHWSLEEEDEEVSKEVVESWETVEEESAELNSEVFMDESEEDG